MRIRKSEFDTVSQRQDQALVSSLERVDVREASEGQRATKRGYRRFLRCSYLLCKISIMNVLKIGPTGFEPATS